MICVQGMFVYETFFALISHFFCFFLYYLPLCCLLNMRTKEIYSSNTTLFVVFNYSSSSFYNQRRPMQRFPRSCCSVKKVGPPGGRRQGFEPELPNSSLAHEPPSYAAPPNLLQCYNATRENCIALI